MICKISKKELTNILAKRYKKKVNLIRVKNIDVEYSEYKGDGGRLNDDSEIEFELMEKEEK